jgi:hypothetical protein
LVIVTVILGGLIMPSPFPGMDPFIEIDPRWEGFHGWFMRKLAEQALPKAQALDCWIDVERTIYRRLPTGEVMMVGAADDVVGAAYVSPAWQDSTRSGGGVALLEPKAVHEVVLDPDTPDRVKQDYLVVRELGQFQRVLAVVEVLSPANKEGTYVPRYREKRRRYLESRSHFMEIDFLRGGENPARDLFPELPEAAYFIFVARKTALGRNDEGHPLSLRDPLPVIGLPLGPLRPDLPLDLADAFRSAYDLSIRPGSIRYRQETPPPPSLDEGDAQWVREIVRSAAP